MSAYKEALGLDPQSVELRIALGSLYLKNRNVIDAQTLPRVKMPNRDQFVSDPRPEFKPVKGAR